MTRIMYDSTSPWDIPRDAEMVAGYVDGRYAWPQAWWDLFPNAVHVTISAMGTRVAHVGDVEVGCIWPPANAVPWVRRARAAGIDPTIYCNELNDWLPVRQAFWAAGEPEPHYWVARYNGVAQIPAGAVGRQYAHPHDGDGVADKPWETGAHYDKSIVVDFWPGVDNRAPGGGGGSAGGADMIMAGTGGPGDKVYAIGASGKRWIETGEEAEGHAQAGVKTYVWPQSVLDRIPTIGEQVHNYGVPVDLPPDRPLRSDGQHEQFHRVIANVNQKVSAGVPVTMTPEDREAIAESVAALITTGATPEQVVDSVLEALRRGTGTE